MFVTRSFGYWHSKDLVNWEFIKPEQWYFEGSNAPTAFNYKDSLVYFAGDPAGYGSILYTDDPKSGEWTPTASISEIFRIPNYLLMTTVRKPTCIGVFECASSPCENAQ